jgi:hypothetical protein
VSIPNLKRCVISPVSGGDFFAFDCVVNENHEESNQITEFPVESGGTISDNIVRLPQRIQLQGVVAQGSVFETLDVLPNDSDRIERALEIIERMMSLRGVFNVTTSIKRYTGMTFESVSVSRNKGTGLAIDLSVSMKKIVFAETATVEPPIPKRKNKIRKGKASGEPVEVEINKSTSFRGVRRLSNNFGVEFP